MSNIDFQNALPANFVLKRPASTSKSILRRSLQEILPVEQVTYQPNQQDIIRFQVGSNSDIWDAPESYFRFDVKQITAGAVSACAFDVGGIHSLFRVIEVRQLGSGVLLQRYDRYNTWFAKESLLKQSPDAVQAMGYSSGDSMTAGYDVSEMDQGTFRLTGTAFAVSDGGVLTASDGDLLNEVAPGDLVIVSGADTNGFSYQGTVVSVTNATTATLSVDPLDALASGPASGAVVIKRKAADSARLQVNSGTTQVFTFMPRLSLFTHNIPLFLMKGGLEISFELELGHRAMHLLPSSSLAAKNVGIDYQITRPRLFASMITPHPDVAAAYTKSWRSDSGLIYSIPSVRYRRLTGTNDETSNSLSINAGVRSARRVYMLVQDTGLSEANSSDAYGNVAQSISTFIRDAINKFQVKVGAYEFPKREVVLDGYSREMYEQLRKIVGNQGPMRLQMKDWLSVDAIYGNTLVTGAATKAIDAKHFILAADFSRDDSVNSEMTGIDLSVVPMVVEIDRSAAHSANGYQGNPMYTMFIEHDAFIKISSTEVSVIH